MRRNATKVAAAVLSLAVTMTSVNIPTTAAAATKKVKLNKTKATLTVGKTMTLKLTQGKKTLKAKFTSSNKKIATVGSKGKVTAKKKGTATITATYKKKKYKCKITVKAKPKPTVKPTAAPTTEPTTAPTAEPTVAPTEAPSTEPTQAPADTVGAITTLEATSASTLKATFESAVPENTKIVVTKGTTEIAGTISKDETNKIVTFTGSGNFTAGTYTMTATLGESTVSKDVEVKDSYVASIELTCKEALTDAEGKTAYIYYDVKNQYGESVRSSENIEWNTSPTKTSVDKSSGKITIKKEDKFVYGSSIYVTGVHVKTGTTLSTSITVGMPQAADSVAFAGFLNKKDTTKAPVESLPADFAKDTYVLLYKTLDQNGNALDIEGFTGDGNITFICDNPQLIASPLEYDTQTYTVNGEEYAAVKIEPGMWVDRGGEVNITWVANKTGKRDSKNFVIGANGILKSLVLSAPVTTVADGDQWVNIPYTATDTTGANVTNYSTIVRSTNTLTLSSTVGELIVKEEKDGTAGIYWNDELSRTAFDNRSAYDNQDRPVSLTTIVVGGESSNMLFNVSDMRRPTTIDKVDINDTWVNGDSATPGLNEWGAFHFIDQYGKAMVDANYSHNAAVEAFFRQANTAEGFNGDAYGIKVDATGTESAILGVKDGIYKYAGDDGKWGAMPSVDDKNNLVFNFNSNKRASDSVKFSIAKIALADKAVNDISKWDDVSKVKTATYTVVPFDAVSNMTINGLDTRLQVETPYMNEFNGTSIGTTNGAFAAHPENDLTVNGVKPYGDGNANDTNKFTVSGIVDGKTVNVPIDKYVELDTEKSAFVTEGNAIKSVTASAITWSDLYNVNDTVKSRKDARKDLRLIAGKGTENVTYLKKTVTISDALSGIAEIRFDATPDVPSLTKLSGYTANIFDQYTAKINDLDGVNCEFSVSNIKENGSALTYLANSFKVTGNTSDKLVINGAEIGDTFTLTATAAGTNVSVSKDITVLADGAAFISSSKEKKTDDSELRKLLGYDR